MEHHYEISRNNTFRSMFFLYFMIFFCIGILPVNIDNLLTNLPKTTKFGIGIVVAGSLIIGIISILIFGYYGDKLIKRKKVFTSINLVWIISFGLIAFSPNYYFYLIFYLTSAFGIGAFVPLGFSMIGEFFSPKERGNKFGLMQFGLILGNGMGIIFGGLLGSYAGPLGWRFAYGLGFIISLWPLISYFISGIEPERGRAEIEFEGFKGEIKYNYKITYNDLNQLVKTKSILGILISVLCSGIANSTLGIWAIYYISSKINSLDAELIATTLYLIAGIGALPGAIVGGRLGDFYFNSGKMKGRVLVSFGGLFIGVIFFLLFYMIPFFTSTELGVVFSWIFFIVIGFLGFFFVSFPVPNQYAIYSEVTVPELRSSANALNGIMVNIGGIIGNLFLSSMIEQNISLLPFSISLVLFVYLFGTIFWIIPYFSYPKESQECREILIKRRRELEEKD